MEPVAVRLFSKPMIDAVWASQDSIIVCGESHLAVYSLQDSSSDKIDAGDSSVNITAVNNLSLQYSHQTDKQWDKVRFDSTHQVIAANSQFNNCLTLFAQHDDHWEPLPGFPTDFPASRSTTAMAFEPLPEAPSQPTISPRRFAAAYESGHINVYAMTRKSCEPLLHLTIGPHDAALALSWAPSGRFLAVASEEAVKVWDVDSAASPVLTWRAAATHWYPSDENNLPSGDETGFEPSLCWDAEGRRLVFAVGRKVSCLELMFRCDC